MATVVTEMPKRAGGGGRAEKYPFDTWLDGQIWQLEQGEDKDYKATNASFLTSLRGAARRRDLKLKTRVAEDHVVIQAVAIQTQAEADAPEEAPAEPKKNGSKKS
jgi:hypothetical protein